MTTYDCVELSSPSLETTTSIMLPRPWSSHGTFERRRAVGSLPGEQRAHRLAATDTLRRPSKMTICGRRAVDRLAGIQGTHNAARGQVEHIPYRAHQPAPRGGRPAAAV